jgi:hypothetical protein
MKHDVSKFCSVFSYCYTNKQSGDGEDEIVQKALALYTLKYPKQQSFTFLYYWYILREHPRWMETPGEQCSRQHLRGAAGGSAAPRSSNHPSEAKDSP